MSELTMVANANELLLPLFKGKYLPEKAHAGLVFDRYFKIWEGRPEDAVRTHELVKPLQRFCDQFNEIQRAGASGPQLLVAHQKRLSRLATRLNYHQERFTVRWRLACGLGNSHPTENGFTFDPVIGVPMITGSAIKGLCRRSSEVMGRNRSEIEEMFGPDEIIPGLGGAFCGDMIFHDGLPAKWPELCVDVINCHHPLYYTESNGSPESTSVLPLETDNPVPVFFLAVEKGTEFIFRFSSRSSSVGNIEKTSEILKAGLELFGIGGKTAIGYGHLV